MSINVHNIRTDFPILSRDVHNKPLVYLDNAATTQKPKSVIDAIVNAYLYENANIHRGVHYLSDLMTQHFEDARKTIQSFIGAQFSQEIIFTAGTTGGINEVAFCFGERFVNPGDEIIVSGMEHHSNLVPWQMLCDRKKAILKIIPFNDLGVLNIDAYKNLLSEKTKLVAVNHVSNTLGTINPIKQIISLAHSVGAKVLIDGAQSIQHLKVDVCDLDCDFYAFSSHKIYGPTGIGVLYGKRDLLLEMPPYQGGGEMVACVTYQKTTYNELPFKFEAGTPPYVNAIGLKAAIDYVNDIGLDNISKYEHELLSYATDQLLSIEGLRIYGQSPNKSSVISFLVDNIHPYDMGMVLDKMGIAVRTGTHCSEPIMDYFGIDGTIRASFAFYNTKEEVDVLVKSIQRARQLF